MTFNPSQLASQIGADATALQNKASDPSHNVWVGASAGTGKTKVLTDRVLRLLLPKEGKGDGASPESILCITFTKAGASEMVARVMEVLSHWAVCSESRLDAELEKLLGHAPTNNQRQKARHLFATVIDLPNGLNITTIHAFCQSLLGRFTLEANLPPNFSVMDDRESQQLMANAKDGLLNDFLGGHCNDDLAKALAMLTLHKNTQQFDSLIKSIVNSRHDIGDFIKLYQGVNGASQSIYEHLNIDVNDTADTAFDLYFDANNFPRDKIMQLAKAFEFGAKGNQQSSAFLYDFCSRSGVDRKILKDDYLSVFFTTTGGVRSDKAVSVGAQKQDPQALEIFQDETNRLMCYIDHLKNIQTAFATSCLLHVADDTLSRYEQGKTLSRKLDYDDLISKTHDLLTSDMNQWVLYKIDNRIDHILVDEAQDTSPDQWSIIQALIGEFYSGYNAHEEDAVNRTLFVVGDIKQSIFSFQGANPDMFARVKKTIEAQVFQAGKSWANIPMNTSFRSTQAVLSLVDQVFKTDDMKHTLTLGGEVYHDHTAYRQGQSGRIELWPLYKAPAQEKRDPWTLPLAPIPAFNAQSALAEKIASQIKKWLDTDEVLKSTGKPITAGDVMILMRSRNALVDHLIRALKSKKIPVSGADRLKISNHIAVLDILAVIDFACMPDDDLSLACVLKSPLIGLNDAAIEDIAYDRSGSLWNALKKSNHGSIVEWLSVLIQSIPSQNAFSAISDVLTRQTPCQNMNGWNAMMARLGEDCFDPLDELLSQAQDFDGKNAGAGIQQFVHMMRTSTSEIKRELDDADGLVRIMTVHASKGLQSPIVILPDTTSVPRSVGQSDDGFLWDDDGRPLWALSSAEQNQTMKDLKDQKNAHAHHEYNRLLYVALTRAEDRLIVCGTLGKNTKNVNEASWYESVHNAMETIGQVEDYDADEGGYTAQTDYKDYIIYETANDVQKDSKEKLDRTSLHNLDMPEWIAKTIVMDQHPPRIL
jgi:ATP-dependent helicase/nuclease subunit A